MKRAVPYVVAGLILLISVVLILVKFLRPISTTPSVPPSEENAFATLSARNVTLDTSSPQKTVETCYHRYFQEVLLENVATQSPQYVAFIQTCFTNGFITKLTDESATEGTDQVLQSQDYLPSWINSIIARTQVEDEITATVSLSLGTNSEVSQLTISLIKDAQGWLINDVKSVNQ